MVNYKELRLFNLLHYRKKAKPEKTIHVFVQELSKDNYKYEYRGVLFSGNEDVWPIVLSARLLVRSGFEKGRKDNGYEVIYIEDNYTVHIIITLGADCFERVQVYAFEEGRNFCDASSQCRISYLHELQNMYGLMYDVRCTMYDRI